MDDTSTTWNTRPTGTRAIERCFAVLDAVTERPTTAGKLSQLLELPRPTVTRLLRVLERHGFVAADENGVYKLGTRPVELAAVWRTQTGPALIAEPYLRQLSDRCGESAYLCVREGFDSVWIAGFESTRAVRFSVPIGQRIGSLHAGGFHKTLLAFAPKSIIDSVLSGPLPKFTENTIVDPEVLAQELERIRVNGLGESLGEVDEGVWSIAAPIRDAVGVVGAAGVGIPEGRASDESLQAIRRYVIETAALISQALGFRGVDEAKASRRREP
jgi:DNA-binding IclR family transcriptional regulator